MLSERFMIGVNENNTQVVLVMYSGIMYVQ